jgi:hypothetical protein
VYRWFEWGSDEKRADGDQDQRSENRIMSQKHSAVIWQNQANSVNTKRTINFS